MFNIGVEGGYRFEIGDRETLHEHVGIGLNIVVEKVKQFSVKFTND
jgi:transketolase